MSLNDDQFHVVKSVHTGGRAKTPAGTYTGGERAEFVITDKGYNEYNPSVVGRVTYAGRNGWTTPHDYDDAYDRAEVGETPPMFTKQTGGYVGSMAVHPDWQGHGLGKELAHRVLDHHWQQNPEALGSMPDHSSLSSASGGMIDHLVPGRGLNGDVGWDEEFDPQDYGVHREHYGYDEDDPDWDGEWDDLGYEEAVEYAREGTAERERENFAYQQMDEARDSSDVLNYYLKNHPDDPLKPGTVLERNSDWTYSIAQPPKYSQAEAQHIVNHGPPEPVEPEAPKPRPFRNGQMRLPGTYQRRLP